MYILFKMWLNILKDVTCTIAYMVTKNLLLVIYACYAVITQLKLDLFDLHAERRCIYYQLSAYIFPLQLNTKGTVTHVIRTYTARPYMNDNRQTIPCVASF